MATKKRTKAKASTQPLERLRGSMRSLQKDAEKLLRKTRKQAGTLIQRDQRKALDRLLGQGLKLRKDFERRAQMAGRQIEDRTETFLAAIEKDLTRRLHEFLKRLDVPSRTEVRTLNRRIAELEKQLTKNKKSSGGAAEPSSDL